MLSFGFGPGKQGGSMKAIEEFCEESVGSLWKETLERPSSIVKVERWETLVRTGSAALRKDNIVAGG